MIKLPSIEVIFKQLAGSLINRSERGIAILIMKDETEGLPPYNVYKSITDAEKGKSKYKPENYKYIQDVFGFALNKVVVINVGEKLSSVAEALVCLESNIKTGWITIADGTAEDYATLVSWIKSKELERKTYKAVAHKAASPDCKHIVNFYNDKVTFADDRAEQSGAKYCPSLIGILASCNIQRGTTYYQCPNLISVDEVADNEKAVGEGKFILINDVDVVKVALGINSLTTTNGITATEDMKFIDIVEAMDLISDDISSVFKNEYLGKYKNNYDNQILFISSINTYFNQLAKDYILDLNYENRADVDVSSQREAWKGVGKTDAENWTEQEVKNNAFKRTVFLFGDIKILGSIENLIFNISLM